MTATTKAPQQPNDRSYGWTQLELPEDGTDLWAHPGAATGVDDAIYVAGSDGHSVHRFDPDGRVDTIELGTVECHGLSVDADGRIWVADPGQKSTLDGGELRGRTEDGQAVLVIPGEGIVQRLADPLEGWRPTGMALHDFGRGSGGRVWVADGYGAQVVHCFDPDGGLLWTSDGTESGTRFSTPHGITIDDRGVDPRVLVADRGNRRIVVLDIDGRYLGEFGSESLTSPSGLAIGRGVLWVSELFGAVVAFGADDAFIERIGSTGDESTPGWPNRLVDSAVAPPELHFGRFRSPHGITALPTGEVVVAEWILGGRATILTPGVR